MGYLRDFNILRPGHIIWTEELSNLKRVLSLGVHQVQGALINRRGHTAVSTATAGQIDADVFLDVAIPGIAEEFCRHVVAELCNIINRNRIVVDESRYQGLGCSTQSSEQQWSLHVSLSLLSSVLN